MTTSKKPPMAKASREFLAGMQLPPSNHTDINIKLAALFGAMLLHCSGLSDGAENRRLGKAQGLGSLIAWLGTRNSRSAEERLSPVLAQQKLGAICKSQYWDTWTFQRL